MAETSADNDNIETEGTPETQARRLSPAALRALKEAEERRLAAKAETLPQEIGGRGGADPARFGDWEVNGRAIDF